MAFPWYQPDIPESYRSTFAARAAESRRREISERAGLLLRLGYPRAEAEARIRGNLVWEYELNGGPPGLEEVGELVAAVYDRQR